MRALIAAMLICTSTAFAGEPPASSHAGGIPVCDQQVASLSTQLSASQAQVQTLQGQVSSLTTQVSNLGAQVQSLQTQANTCASNLSACETSLASCPPPPPPPPPPVTGAPQWGTRGRDGQRSYRAGVAGPARASIRWQISPSGGSYTGCPVLGADGRLYATIGNSAIAAFDPATGAESWRYTESGATFGCASVGSNGSLYASAHTAAGESLHAIATNGALRWTLALGGFYDFARTSLGADGTVYVSSPHGKSWAISDGGTSGAIVWSFPAGSGLTKAQYHQALAPDSSVLYVATASGNNGQDVLYALRTSDGAQLASTAFGNQENWASIAVAANGTVLADTSDPGYAIATHAFGFPPVSGSLASWPPSWTFTVGGWYWQSGAVASDGSYYPSRDVNGSGTQYSFSPSGASGWSLGTGGVIVRSALDSSGTIYVLGASLQALRAGDGSALWSASLGAGGNDLAIAGDGTIFVTTDGDLIYAFQR